MAGSGPAGLSCAWYLAMAGHPVTVFEALPEPGGMLRWGIPAYRLLQRRGVPFAAGVLQANDLDYPVARALAAELVEEGAYQPIGAAALERARALMASCERVVCTLSAFGPGNAGNELLWQQAGQAGKQTDWRTL